MQLQHLHCHPLQCSIASLTSLGLASCLLSRGTKVIIKQLLLNDHLKTYFSVVMVGTILHLLLWPKMLSQDKRPQPLLRLPNLLSSSSPPPLFNSLLLHLPGEGSSLISSREDTNSSRNNNRSSSSSLLQINLLGGQVSSLLSSSSSNLPRLLQLLTSSRHPNLPSPQLLSQLSIKSSKMLWRASDQNVNKVLLKITLRTFHFLVVECHPCFHFRSRY